MQGRKGIPGTTCRSTEGEIMTVEEDNLAIRKEWFRLKEIVERLKKRIEELSKHECRDDGKNVNCLKHERLDELQKILGDKK